MMLQASSESYESQIDQTHQNSTHSPTNVMHAAGEIQRAEMVSERILKI